MKKICRWRSWALGLSVTASALTLMAEPAKDGLLTWPTSTRVMRPWTRWWWPGSAVDHTGLTRQLTAFHEAGMGGAEICAIYGVRGYEEKFVDFLSAPWMKLLTHTTKEAERLDLGIDLTTTTGFPMGGPWVSRQDASSAGELRRYTVIGDGRLDPVFGVGHLNKVLPDSVRSMIAVGPKGEQLDLTARVKDGYLDWTAPLGTWRLYAIVQRQPVQLVKRAAPGGEGYVTDPLSVTAIDHFLARFDEAFKGYDGPKLRAQFMDSYEQVTSNTPDGGSISANWTNDLFTQFKARRGYDLRTQIPAFFGDSDPETVARVWYDYRETVNQLHQGWVARWTEWSHAHGSVTREQAHCSPSNILDTYAASDIPETEGAFRGGTDIQIPFVKLASSATHLSGRTLASCETFTWFADFYDESLGQLKPVLDRFFLSGINHIFYHGTPYSPENAPWPGWSFYAPVHFGLEGGLWHDLPAFNAYITRCQTILQSGQPANDVLLYFPIADLWQIPGEKPLLRRPYTPDEDRSDGLVPYEGVEEEAPVLEFQHVGNGMLNGVFSGGFIEGSPFYYTAVDLWDRGYGYDEISDKFLLGAKGNGGAVEVGGHAYQAIVVPPCRLMPVETLRRLVDLAKGGATVIVQGTLPNDVPGLDQLPKRRAEFRALLAEIELHPAPNGQFRQAKVGAGRFLNGNDVAMLLREATIAREPMSDAGLQFIRRRDRDGYAYFVVNKSGHAIDQWVALGTAAETVAILDPLLPNRSGMAALRRAAGGTVEVFLQLQPDQSLILRTSVGQKIAGAAWAYDAPAALAPRVIQEPWQVQFIEGGPVLPQSYETRDLASWTTRTDAELKRFAGTARYRTEFDLTAAGSTEWRLELGRVCESARIRLNGRDVATLWCAPFSINVGQFLQPGRNVLEVEVTNLPANRIADLDRRHVDWKIFYNANVRSVNGTAFDTAGWTLRDSGLLGPVRLVPLQTLNPVAAEAAR